MEEGKWKGKGKGNGKGKGLLFIGVPFVHLCIKSPMFITMASLTGGASMNSPDLCGFSICLAYCQFRFQVSYVQEVSTIPANLRIHPEIPS